MNILNWILFVLLNVYLSSGVSSSYRLGCIFSWLVFNFLDFGLFWLLLTCPLQFLILPILYEFINKKSQIFLFLNKQKKLTSCLKILFLALTVDVISILVIAKSFEVPVWYIIFFSLLFFCVSSLFASYFGLAIWLRLRKCIIFSLRKIIKFIGKWLSKRKFATLKNIIITMHLIFAGEIVAICFSPNTDSYLFLLFSEIMPLLLVEIISILSFVKKQKVKPFQKGVIFIIALLIFIHTQLATILQFLTILRWDSHFDPNNISHLNNVIVNFLINIMGLQEF